MLNGRGLYCAAENERRQALRSGSHWRCARFVRLMPRLQR